MEIFVLGLNHKTAPVEVRERLAIPVHKTRELLERMGEKGIFDERLVLSTCNRTEIYGVGGGDEAVSRAKTFLGEYSHLEVADFEDKLYVLRQPDSIEHLFSVASGLDSMVVGETEIIGQVKDAYQTALKARQTGKVLNNLFQRSLKVAKNLRTQTGIGTGKVSVASVAVDLAEKIFSSLKGVRVLVIGTGEMSTQVVKAMVSRGAVPVIVSSRHLERAKALAAELGGEALAFEDYESAMPRVDVLVAATAAPRVLIRQAQVKEWMRARHDKPLFLVDVAVPRNIDVNVEKIDNAYLYNIDDLRTVAEKNLEHRESQLKVCFQLVHAQTAFYMDWLKKEFESSSAARAASS